MRLSPITTDCSINGELTRIREEEYSRNIFNYTKLHEESRILLSENSNFLKSKQLTDFNINYMLMKQKSKLITKFGGIKKYGWKGRKVEKECSWSKIEKPLMDNNPEEIIYFKKRIEDYLNKISSKKYIQKIFIVTFPHRANLFPVKNQFNQMIYYKVSVAKIVDDILKNYNNATHLNFSNEIKEEVSEMYNVVMKFVEWNNLFILNDIKSISQEDLDKTELENN